MSHADFFAPTELIAARWVAPMDRPIIEDGAIVVREETIVAAGTSRELRARHPDAALTELGAAVLMPGLVNAHVHLELSHLACGQPPTRFVEWLMRLAPRLAPAPQELKTTVKEAISEGVRQCLAFGVTTVGDISRHVAITRPLLGASPLQAVSFGEVLAMAKRRGLLAERLAAAGDSSQQDSKLQIGISPHAPYSVEAEGFRACQDVARKNHLHLATHLAETKEEAEFLAHHTGPFRELWDYLGAWDDAVSRFSGGPIRYAQSLGLLDYPTVLAHVNFCDDEEMAILARGCASVVYCPRTHAYFRHPPHRWQEMLKAGINLAVGTDSTASSADLNLVDDLRLLHRIAPQVPVTLLWELATLRAARVLGMHKRVGSLTPGKAADFIAFPTSSDQPLSEVLQTSILPSHVWIGGLRR